MRDAIDNKEKIQSIIDLLQQQLANNAGKENMLLTVQSLIAELNQCVSSIKERKNISVVMPIPIATIKEENPQLKIVPTSCPAEETQQSESEMLVKDGLPQIISSKEDKANNLNEVLISNEKIQQPVKEQNHFRVWEAFGISNEPPTIAHHQPASHRKELNEQYTANNENEIAQSLQSMPIHDLATAIGINDRYLFINELFRGDEFMFERSIITLNKFDSYDQAHSWIERELRLKLGWDMDNHTTKQFEALMRRRFL